MRVLAVIFIAAAIGGGFYWARGNREEPVTGRSEHRLSRQRMLSIPVEAGLRENIPTDHIGEQFILQHMTNADGTLKTTLTPANNPNDENFAWGDESLSESTGLWLLYLHEKGDADRFAKTVDLLLEHFWRDGWVAWKIRPDGKKASTNALVDDLRIAEALYRAGFSWENETYLELADSIGRSIQTYQLVNGLPADFYDYDHDWTSETLTVSYINPVALATMAARQTLEPGVYERAHIFLKQLPHQNGIYPFSYDLVRREFRYQTVVNLIDQLFIAYHRQQAGISSPEFWSLLKSAYRQHGVLYGQWDGSTGEPIVSYESPAAYGLAILAALEAGDTAFATELYRLMSRLQVLNPNSPYYGGYVFSHQTHIFDNLIPLLAVMKLHGKVP